MHLIEHIRKRQIFVKSLLTTEHLDIRNREYSDSPSKAFFIFIFLFFSFARLCVPLQIDKSANH